MAVQDLDAVQQRSKLCLVTAQRNICLPSIIRVQQRNTSIVPNITRVQPKSICLPNTIKITLRKVQCPLMDHLRNPRKNRAGPLRNHHQGLPRKVLDPLLVLLRDPPKHPTNQQRNHPNRLLDPQRNPPKNLRTDHPMEPIRSMDPPKNNSRVEDMAKPSLPQPLR